jgi:hypothetical protein
LVPRGTQFIGGPPIHCEGGKIGKQFENRSCSVGYFFILKFNQFIFLAPRVTQFIGVPPIHKIGKQFENKSCSLG